MCVMFVRMRVFGLDYFQTHQIQEALTRKQRSPQPIPVMTHVDRGITDSENQYVPATVKQGVGKKKYINNSYYSYVSRSYK